MPSISPWLAIAPYIRASPRAVTTPLAAGISASSNGLSPRTAAVKPGKYMERKAPDSWLATVRVTRSTIGLPTMFCGMMISAALVGDRPAAGPDEARRSK